MSVYRDNKHIHGYIKKVVLINYIKNLVVYKICFFNIILKFISILKDVKMNNKQISTANIQNLCDNIRSICSDNLCSPFADCRESCERILNATSILLNDATVLQNKTDSISQRSTAEIAILLQNILTLLSDTDNIVNIEAKIANLFVNNNINPQNLLFIPPWSGDFLQQ